MKTRNKVVSTSIATIMLIGIGVSQADSNSVINTNADSDIISPTNSPMMGYGNRMGMPPGTGYPQNMPMMRNGYGPGMMGYMNPSQQGSNSPMNNAPMYNNGMPMMRGNMQPGQGMMNNMGNNSNGMPMMGQMRNMMMESRQHMFSRLDKIEARLTAIEAAAQTAK